MNTGLLVTLVCHYNFSLGGLTFRSSITATVGLITYVVMPGNMIFLGELPGFIYSDSILTPKKHSLFYKANVRLLPVKFDCRVEYFATVYFNAYLATYVPSFFQFGKITYVLWKS